MEKNKSENAEFYNNLAKANAMLASVQYAVSNLLAIHSAYNIALPEEQVMTFSQINLHLSLVKQNMDKLVDKYKHVAWKSK